MSKDIEWYKEQLKCVRIQRNNFETLLRVAERTLDKFKTPVMTKAHGHCFMRYLMTNEFAEEMKCSCGYVIPPCKDQDEVTDAMISITGEVVICSKK